VDLTKYGRYNHNADWEQVQSSVALAPRPSNSAVVDTYEGVLCTVTTEAPPVPPEEEEKKFPWLLVGIGGSVAAIGLLALAKKGGV